MLQKKFQPVLEATGVLEAAVREVASYVEFLKLDATRYIGPGNPDTMRRLTSNPVLMRPVMIDEFRTWQSHYVQGENIADTALLASDELKQALTEFETCLGEIDGDPGCAFARNTMLPQMKLSLDMLDASLSGLGNEVKEIAESKPQRPKAIVAARPAAKPAFQNVETTQASVIDMQAARDAAVADPNSNVVSLFGSGKAKG